MANFAYSDHFFFGLGKPSVALKSSCIFLHWKSDEIHMLIFLSGFFY